MIQDKDGNYIIYESSTQGLDRIKRDAEAVMTYSLSDVPANLKCALTGNLLREAVALPCCSKLVDDSAIRQKLLASSLTCPFCNTSGISPDMVRNNIFQVSVAQTRIG